MRRGWELKRLGDIISLEYGKPLPESKRKVDGTYPVYGANGEKGRSDEYYCSSKSIIVGRKGSAGEINFTEDKFWPLDVTYYVTYNKEQYDLGFIFYLLVTLELPKLAKGVKPGINRNEVYSINVLIPPLAEQKRIVSILDEAFVAIAKAKENTEKNLQNARELFESYLQRVLYDKKWIRKPLGEVCIKVEYGSSSKSKKEGKLPVLRMGNIQNGRFVWDNLVYSDNEEENKQYLLKYNDVLFNRTNSPELVGKTAIYKGEMPAIFAGYLIRIHRKEDLLDADYLNYYLNSSMAIEYGKTVVISSVNQANINGTKLKTYPIPVPPLIDQQIIVNKLDVLRTETKKLEALYQQKLSNLEELKKAILQKAFNPSSELGCVGLKEDRIVVETS